MRSQLRGGLCDLLAEHRVLARLVTTLITDWTSATAELLVRFAEGAPRIAAVVGDGRALGRVARVDAGLSGPHDGGR